MILIFARVRVDLVQFNRKVRLATQGPGRRPRETLLQIGIGSLHHSRSDFLYTVQRERQLVSSHKSGVDVYECKVNALNYIECSSMTPMSIFCTFYPHD